MFFGTCGPPHVHAVGSKTAPSSRFVRFSVGHVISCRIISKLDVRHVPIICHVALEAWNSRTTPQDVRPSLRSPAQGSFRQPTWRPSCILRAPILRFFCFLLNNSLFFNVSSLFVCFGCCNIIIISLCTVFLPVRWYPQLPVDDILCASTVSAPRRTSRC